MQTKSGYAQRGARMRRVFGSDDLAVVTRDLRERRAVALAMLVRRAFAAIAAIVAELGTTGRARPPAPGLSGNNAQLYR